MVWRFLRRTPISSAQGTHLRGSENLSEAQLVLTHNHGLVACVDASVYASVF